MGNNLVALSTEYDDCKMKKASDDPCQWYAELEYLQQQMEHAGAQKKTEAEMVGSIMNRIRAKYKVVMSALRAKPVKEQTLDLVRTVYWEYWDANLKGMEQPNESDESVTLYTDSGKQSDDIQDKNEGYAFFIRMSMNEEVFHHRTRNLNAREDPGGAWCMEQKDHGIWCVTNARSVQRSWNYQISE